MIEMLNYKDLEFYNFNNINRFFHTNTIGILVLQEKEKENKMDKYGK